MWGPGARVSWIRAATTTTDPRALDYTRADVTIGDVPCLALRVSYVGELGWEIYAPTEYGLAAVGHALGGGPPRGVSRRCGRAAFDSLRLEKGYRLWGQDIHTEYNPYEAGLDFTVAWDKGDFIGREALVRDKAAGPTRKLSAWSSTTRASSLMGKEPILVGDA